MFLRLAAILLLVTSCAAHAEGVDTEIVANESFEKWLDGFAQKAIDNGISHNTLNDALGSVTLSKKVVSLDRKQPEKKLTMEEYLANVINDARIEKGRRLMQENKALLADIYKRTGVDPEFIVALWGLESGYGERQGDFQIVSALATLAYEGRRRQFFEDELLSALVILEQQQMPASELRGSWAGAMGQSQFMPSSYLAYAVDYNMDGRVDIWNSKEDVLGSIANYLRTVGWGKSDELKRKTLMDWNRSTYFVASVFQLAEAIRD